MTKRDYVKIAAVLNKWYDSRVACVATDLADVFEKDNPAFDRKRWFDAIVKAE